MKQLFLSLFLLSIPCHGEDGDMLRFKNGDQLHGRYSGMTEGSSVAWSRNDVAAVVNFKTEELRQIVLRGGRPLQTLASLSHIGTVNGDRIPGIVRELDGERLILETEFAGTLEIPRTQVGLIAPSPLGGRVLYNGPFDPAEWLMVDSKNPDGFPALTEPKIDSKPATDAKKGEELKEEEAAPQWDFSGSAWYWRNKKIGTALVRKTGVPDRAIIQFDLAWKNRLSVAIAFHADFAHPPENLEEKENPPVIHPSQPTALTSLFGSSYVLQLYSNYVNLYRTSFDDDGEAAQPELIRTTHAGLRLGDSGAAKVELRCNRDSGEIILFVDGEFVAQWNELAIGDEIGYGAPGDGLGFYVQQEDSPIRISEIIVAEWNGMPDAARSLQVDDADIVLLANGTDRFSGTVTSVKDGLLSLEGRYGDFKFPIADIAEVRFAKSKLAKADDKISDTLVVRLHPLGRITGKPLAGNSNSLRILNGAAGEIDLNLDSAVMLEFEPSISFLDDWDIEF